MSSKHLRLNKGQIYCFTLAGLAGQSLSHVPPEALVFQSKVKTGKWNQNPLVSKVAQINTNMQIISYHPVSLLLIRYKRGKQADEINHICRGSYWGRNSLWGVRNQNRGATPRCRFLKHRNRQKVSPHKTDLPAVGGGDK